MNYKFSIKGHKNITATHKTTLEFTKDTFLTKKGDCITGINSDFELKELKKFLNSDKIKITITAKGLKDTITATPNKKFSSSQEMVIRMSEHDSERTFAVRSSKASKHISRLLIRALKEECTGEVEISLG